MALGASLFVAGAAVGTVGGFALHPDPAEVTRTAQRSTPDGGGSYSQAPNGPDKEASPSVDGGVGSDDRERRTAGVKPERAPDEKSAEAREPEAERWQHNAAAMPADAGDKPRIAIVLDDMGLEVDATRDAIDLPSPITLSFLTYAETDDLHALTASARRAGHEVMAHVPMQPSSASVDPGPHALTRAMSGDAIRANLAWGLDRLSGYVGINNHMGSAATADGRTMRRLMAELDDRGLLFLDSRTTAETKAIEAAKGASVPHTERDVFLDNVKDPGAIREQLRELEALARRDGSAVAIGHPYDVTISVLADWLPEARERGVALVPISAVVQGADRRNVAALPE
ncbi:divergent polysaccharide deacetylase family protein [Limimonas halophila]|nr:divergent polysaccharide deacetylase family protein [Limimonas halophila]